MSASTARLTGMLYRRPVIIDSALPVGIARARIRDFAISRGLPELEAFRRRQIIGWRLSAVNEDALFQPEYGDCFDIDGARLVALVEPAVSGSRVRGYVVLSPLIKIMTSAFILAVVFAAMMALGQTQEPAAKVLGTAAAVIGGAVLMVRSSLASTSGLVEARLRRCLDSSAPRVAA